jgi:3-oxoacyl-ACP reductase-like protein
MAQQLSYLEQLRVDARRDRAVAVRSRVAYRWALVAAVVDRVRLVALADRLDRRSVRAGREASEIMEQPAEVFL